MCQARDSICWWFHSLSTLCSVNNNWTLWRGVGFRKCWQIVESGLLFYPDYTVIWGSQYKNWRIWQWVCEGLEEKKWNFKARWLCLRPESQNMMCGWVNSHGIQFLNILVIKLCVVKTVGWGWDIRVLKADQIAESIRNVMNGKKKVNGCEEVSEWGCK